MKNLRQQTALLLEGNGEYRKIGHIIDVFLITLIMINVVAIVLESVVTLAQQYKHAFLMLELGSVSIFCYRIFITLLVMR